MTQEVRLLAVRRPWLPRREDCQQVLAQALEQRPEAVVVQVVNAADRVSRRGQGLVQAIQLQRASADQAKELGAPLAGPIAGDLDVDLVQQRVGGLEAGFEAALLEKNVGVDDALGERSRGRGHWRAPAPGARRYGSNAPR